ncbi:MAG: hypothetical protein AAFU79_19270, partial [Myxococcota bacterium]
RRRRRRRRRCRVTAGRTAGRRPVVVGCRLVEGVELSLKPAHTVRNEGNGDISLDDGQLELVFERENFRIVGLLHEDSLERVLAPATSECK